MLGCAGDIPTLETLAAAHWLRENSPELKVSVVNVVDLMTLFPREFHPHGSRPDLDVRVRGGDRKSHHLLEGALRGPARDKQLDMETMNPATETLLTGLLKDRGREGSRGTNYGA